MEEGTSTQIYKCLIAVSERGHAILLKAEPDIFEHDVFDGDDLEDNINSNKKDIPKQFGVYKCDIEARWSKYWTDCGYEHDCYISIKNIEKQDFVLAATPKIIS